MSANEELPEGWCKAALGEQAYYAGRIGWRGLKAEEYTESGPLLVSVHGLNHGERVAFHEACHISQERYKESPEIMLQENDILLANRLGQNPWLPPVFKAFRGYCPWL
jgi:type I restriction enzyme S subunit